jgi:hypothetical protein
MEATLGNQREYRVGLGRTFSTKEKHQGIDEVVG